MWASRPPLSSTIVAGLAGLALAGLAACNPVERRVSFDPAADFSAYRTFAIDQPLSAEPADRDPIYNPVINQRIRDAVSRALSARGLEPGIPADVSVRITAGSEQRQSIHYIPDAPLPSRRGYLHSPAWRPVVIPSTAGMIAVDIFDNRSGRPVWHGAAEMLVDADETTPQAIREVVEVILADFPPGRPARDTGAAPAAAADQPAPPIP